LERFGRSLHTVTDFPRNVASTFRRCFRRCAELGIWSRMGFNPCRPSDHRHTMCRT
jgi:hypothetical protein